MPERTVHLAPVTVENFEECVSLDVDAAQKHLVASNMKSLAQAKVNPRLQPWAVYAGTALGWEKPQTPMLGFTM